jgi:hypothetical protein
LKHQISLCRQEQKPAWCNQKRGFVHEQGNDENAKRRKTSSQPPFCVNRGVMLGYLWAIASSAPRWFPCESEERCPVLLAK